MSQSSTGSLQTQMWVKAVPPFGKHSACNPSLTPTGSPQVVSQTPFMWESWLCPLSDLRRDQARRVWKSVQYGTLSSCRLGGAFPPWLQSTLSHHPRTPQLSLRTWHVYGPVLPWDSEPTHWGFIWSIHENNKAHFPSRWSGAPSALLQPTHSTSWCSSLILVHLQQRGSGPPLSDDLLTPPWNVTLQGLAWPNLFAVRSWIEGFEGPSTQ